MAKFVLFKKQPGEITPAFSIVKDEEVLKQITDQAIGEKVIQIPDKDIYTKEDIESYTKEAQK